MPHLQIKRYDTQTVLYEGSFDTACACIEAACSDNVTLSHADLRYTNLQNASLDGIIMPHVLLDYTNLNGANISESNLHQASIQNSDIVGTCLCETNLTGVNFKNSIFGATDIAYSTLDCTVFNTASSLGLNFRDATTIQNCLYKDAPFSRAPVIINGMDWPIYLFDAHMGIGTRLKRYDEWFSAENDSTSNKVTDNMAHVTRFVQMHREALSRLASFHSRNSHSIIFPTKTKAYGN